MQHNFDEPVMRSGTDSKKYLHYGPDVLPMWIADTDFKCPQPVIDACVKRMMEGVYGYPDVSEDFKVAVALWQKKRFGWEVPSSFWEALINLKKLLKAIKEHQTKGILQCFPKF